MNTRLEGRSLVEVIFCSVYLIYDAVAAMIFLSRGGLVFTLFFWLTTILLIGDAFHLVPRILIILRGQNERLLFFKRLGLLISSITMTFYYVILYWIWRVLFVGIHYPVIIVYLLYASVAIRILLCLFPQNDWFGGNNPRFRIYRNLPFFVTGACVIALYTISGNAYGYGLWKMAVAIAVSFACYLPVIVSKKKIVGMFMMPKTLAYMYMIALGLFLKT